MNRIHEYLERKSSAYARWHAHPHRNVHHFLALIIAGFVFVGLIYRASSEDIIVAYDVYATNQHGQDVRALALNSLDLPGRAARAEMVIRGLVAETTVTEERNEWGDQLLMTRAKINVIETLKGPVSQTVDIYMIGGTLNGLTMRSSKHPEPLKKGEEAVTLLKKDGKGRYVLSGGEMGLLKRQADGTYGEEAFSIEELRGGVR